MKRALMLTASLLCAACGYDIEKKAGTGAPTTLAPGTSLSFDSVYASVIRPVCLECHAAPRNAGGINLDTYEAILASKSIVRSAVASKAMPESVGRSLTSEQRTLLLAWLDAGAPRDPLSPANPSPPGPSPAPSPGTNPPPCREDGPGHDRRGDDDHCEPTNARKDSV